VVISSSLEMTRADGVWHQSQVAAAAEGAPSEVVAVALAVAVVALAVVKMVVKAAKRCDLAIGHALAAATTSLLGMTRAAAVQPHGQRRFLG